MKTTVPTLLLTVAACLLVGVHRMPAPITVPPEATPQPSIMPNAEPPPAKQATKKAAKEKKEPPKEANQPKARSMAGTWTGNLCSPSSDGTAKQIRLDIIAKFKVSADETTVAELRIVEGRESPYYTSQCIRKGDILTWKHIQYDPPYDGKKWVQVSECKLTFGTNGTTNFDCIRTYVGDGVIARDLTVRTVAMLSRQP